ncbi:MAG: VacJ family lipoprotein [Proteobacteria bacterium]|nr:VacJ family lipoprotein [Pseudomonadota bacterium]
MKFTRTFIALAAVILTGCATPPKNASDPLEPFNRGVYTFNDTLDKAVVKPVAQGYNKVMPDTGKSMVINFFSNLDDVVVTANDLLQFKFIQALSDGMRVLVNSTVGVAGLVDVASMNLEKHNEDFGQTLGYWGIKSGPYLVVPVLGPSTFRDSIGDIGDSQFSMISKIKKVRTRNQMYLTKGIKRRAQLLDNENLLDGAVIDRYAFIRDAYLQRRESLVYDGNPPQDTSEDDVNTENSPTPAPMP